MYKQVYDPVSDSLGLSSIFAVLPLLALFVLLGGREAEGVVGRTRGLGRGDRRRDRRLLHAGRSGAAVGIRGRCLRPLPDHVDRRQRAVDLQHDGGDRRLRRAAPIVRRDLRRPARPGRDHRLLLRRAARGARRLRHAGRDHAPSCSSRSASRRSRRRRSRWSRTPRPSRSARSRSRSSRSPRSPDCHKDDLGAMVGRQTPLLALFVPLILVGHGRRDARHPPDLACGARRRPRVRHRAVRDAPTTSPSSSPTSSRRSSRPARSSRCCACGALRAAARRGHRDAPRRWPALAGAAAHDPEFEADVRARQEGGARDTPPRRRARLRALPRSSS